MAEDNRVVVTGMGCVTPIGLDKESAWSNVLRGISGIRRIADDRVKDLPVKLAAEASDFDPLQYMDAKEARTSDRFIQLAVAAAIEAVRDSQLQIGINADARRTGVWIGSGVGGIATFEQRMKSALERGFDRVSPYSLPMFLPNMAASRVAIRFRASGITGCSAAACASGAQSIGEAYHAIRRGAADVMIAGGTEAPICAIGLASFAAMRTLSLQDEPAAGSRPFDRRRDGFVMGEGAGVLILESLSHAKARGARIYAEMRGYGACGEGYHVAAPRADGSDWARTIALALADAGLQPGEVQYINAHGTGTLLNDLAETNAIKSVFGAHAYELNISSTKSATGHLLGASGAVEAIFTVLALRDQIVPPTIHYGERDEALDLHYTPNRAERRRMDAAISNTFAFGGQNAVIVFVRYAGP
jgi:3-oxoacyl-[acyl-carrier-protein] synthase II